MTSLFVSVHMVTAYSSLRKVLHGAPRSYIRCREVKPLSPFSFWSHAVSCHSSSFPMLGFLRSSSLNLQEDELWGPFSKPLRGGQRASQQDWGKCSAPQLPASHGGPVLTVCRASLLNAVSVPVDCPGSSLVFPRFVPCKALRTSIAFCNFTLSLAG